MLLAPFIVLFIEGKKHSRFFSMSELNLLLLVLVLQENLEFIDYCKGAIRLLEDKDGRCFFFNSPFIKLNMSKNHTHLPKALLVIVCASTLDCLPSWMNSTLPKNLLQS